MTRRRKGGGGRAFHKSARVSSGAREMHQEGTSRAPSFIHARPALSTVLGATLGFVLGMLGHHGD